MRATLDTKLCICAINHRLQVVVAALRQNEVGEFARVPGLRLVNWAADADS